MGENETPVTGKPFSDEDKIYLFLAYFGLLSLIPFLMFKDKRSDPQKEYVYWHARQGLALTIASAVIWVVGMVGLVIPILNILIGIVLCLFWVLVLVVVIMCWVKAFGGEKWAVPGVSKIAEMFN